MFLYPSTSLKTTHTKVKSKKKSTSSWLSIHKIIQGTKEDINIKNPIEEVTRYNRNNANYVAIERAKPYMNL